MNKIFSWPVVFIVCGIEAGIVNFQIFEDTACRHRDSFGLAMFTAMGMTYIAIALLERFRRKIFNGGKLLFYRFWLV